MSVRFDDETIKRLQAIAHEAGRRAVERLHAAGVATHFMRGGRMYEESPTGEIRELPHGEPAESQESTPRNW